MGYLLGIGGVVTFKKESDGRYPTRNRPGKHRAGDRFSLPDSVLSGKKKNESSYIPLIAQKLQN